MFHTFKQNIVAEDYLLTEITTFKVDFCFKARWVFLHKNVNRMTAQ